MGEYLAYPSQQNVLWYVFFLTSDSCVVVANLCVFTVEIGPKQTTVTPLTFTFRPWKRWKVYAMGTTLRTRRFRSSTRWGFKSSWWLGRIGFSRGWVFGRFLPPNATEGLVTGFRKNLCFEYMASWVNCWWCEFFFCRGKRFHNQTAYFLKEPSVQPYSAYLCLFYTDTLITSIMEKLWITISFYFISSH